MFGEKNQVLIIGGGSREHAQALKLLESPQVDQVYVSPGNGGTIGGRIEAVGIPITEHTKLIEFAKEHEIDFVVVSPDDALAAGLADEFRQAGFITFGASQKAAQIESSKAFAKKLMADHGIPTAAHQTFTDIDEAKAYVQAGSFPVVVKASGLALGKGVYICVNETEATTALEEIMLDRKFGDSGSEVVIEAFMVGTELSTHAFCDGETAVVFPSSQDYKQIGDGNRGPNTGGMGVVAPLPWASAALMERAEQEIITPILAALKSEGAEFQGLLYPGLMEKEGHLNVVEFNARFGQPECECYLRLLESDLFEVMTACAIGKLADVQVTWSDKFVAGVILAAGGYPESYEKGKVITGIEDAESDPDIVVFHAGTKLDGNTLVTNGGRVLHVTATADTLGAAVEKAYAACEKIEFEGKYMRTDIGSNTLNKA